MKFARLSEIDSEVPVLIDRDSVFDLSGIVDDFDRPSSEADGLSQIRHAANGDLSLLAGASSMRVGTPICRENAVVCIGMNVDIVLTWTPERVALSGRFLYLTAVDVVEVEIESLGSQRQFSTRA